MKVLFVSGANNFLINPKMKNQAESLENKGIHIDHFLIKGKGFRGYLKNVPRLRRHLKTHKYDIIHAHYSFCGFVSALAGAKPLVVSLMGSDVQAHFLWKKLIKFFNTISWNAAIVKSGIMRETINIPEAVIIPNGVDLNKFKIIEKNIARKRVYFGKKKHVIFVGYPHVHVKNFELAERACSMLDKQLVELTVVKAVDHSLIPYYMNAADLLLLTSFSEGSPNVIKEAMACNCPVVATDVGDIKEIIGKTEGCFLASFDPGDVAEKIKSAVKFNKRTEGRKRLISLGLDEETIAKTIVQLYNRFSRHDANKIC